MLFGIYSVVTLASLVLSSGFAKYVKEKLKEEGYVYPWDDKNTKEKIFDFLPFAIIQILPIAHFLPLAGLIIAIKKDEAKDALYELIKKDLIKKSAIVKNDDLAGNTKFFDDQDKDEPRINTNQAAANYWKEMQKHNVPTIQLGNYEDDNEEEKGYQKTLKK